MKIIKRIILSLAVFCSVVKCDATHLMGGEITWQCSNGNYVFWLKVYRDCSPVSASFTTAAQTINVVGHPTLASMTANFVDLNDLSQPGCGFDCDHPNFPPTPTPPGFGSVQEFIFKTNPINLGNFTPPPAGWLFYWSTCCRNTNQNLSTQGAGMGIRSRMFSYNGQLATPCFDNSPAFAERPSSAICSGYSFTYNHTAIDVEFDSVYYSWAQPLSDNGVTLLTFNNTPYTTNNQLPGNPQLNSATGEVNINPPPTNGNFATCIKVEAYKCNIKVAEIYRDIQVSLAAGCAPIFGGGSNNPPFFDDMVTGLPQTSLTDTVIAGDSTFFNIRIRDSDFNANPFALQQVTVEVVGAALDSIYFAAPFTGCLRPPCATMSPATPYTFPGASIFKMNWKTSCAHLPRKDGCATLSNVYTFVLKARDTYCPVPARKNVTIDIVVVEPPKLLPPKLHCVSVDTSGHVTLNWDPPSPKDTFNTFYNYQILRALSPNGPFTTIDSVFTNNPLTSYFQNTYTDTTINAHDTTYYYAMLTRCGCDSSSLSEDTSRVLAAMRVYAEFPTPGLNVATVKWDPLSDTLPPTAMYGGYYYIYRTNHSLGNTSVFVDSVFADSAYVDSLFMCAYLDTITGCLDSITWRVGVPDSSGCTSWSAFGGATQTQDTIVEPPVINCVSVLDNGNVVLDFSVPLAQDTGRIFGGYLVYQSNTSPTGPYAWIGTIPDKTIQTFTDVGANAYSGGPYYYYITTFDSCGMIESDSSNIVTPIILTANMIGPDVVLNWNSFQVPAQGGTYEIWKKIASSPSFTFLTNPPANATSYNDPVTLCNDSVVYQIRLVHNTPDSCVSYSSIDGDSVQLANPVIGAPEPRCTQVALNGDVSIDWDLPVDTANYFASYTVYHSSNPAGPFNPVGTLTSYQNSPSSQSFSHAGANANVQPQYYTIVTRAGCDVLNLFNSPNSDTIATIKLNANPVLGFAQLSWNAPHNPATTGSAAQYRVMRALAGTGVYSQRGPGVPVNPIPVSNTYQFNDSIDECNTIYDYRIELDNSLTCTTISSVASDTFTYAGIPTGSPSLRCVSVNTNGTIELTWDTAGLDFTQFSRYEVVRNGTPLATINNASANTFIDLTANGNVGSENYYIYSVSGCNANITSASSAIINSIYLQADSNNTAQNPGLATLNWNNQPIQPTATTNYTIWSDYYTPGVPSQIANLLAFTTNQSINDCDTGITHYIEVTDDLGCVSKSNEVNGVYTHLGNVTAPPTLHCVSVNGNGTIELTWDTAGLNFDQFTGYEIYRNGTSIANINSNTIFNYTDVGANGNAASVTYHMTSLSGCIGTVASQNSTPMNSIFLQADSINTGNVPGQAELTWNPLPLLTGSSSWYHVYSDYSSPGSPGFLDSAFNSPAYENIWNCDTGITHYVQVDDVIGCFSKSNVVSGQYSFLGNVTASPVLHCVSVLSNGNIELTWDTAGLNFNEFTGYDIYRDGAYAATVNNQNLISYIDAGANGNLDSVNYYMLSRSGCIGTVASNPPSNAMSSIFLETFSNNIMSDPGNADLQWNFLPLQTTSSQYYIYSDYHNPAVPAFLDSTTLNEFTEFVYDCDTGITHYILVDDAIGCSSKSNVVTKQFTYLGNVIASPTLHCLDVTQPSGAIELTWVSNTNDYTDFHGFQIYQDGSPISIATVNDSTATTYLDASVNGNIASHQYYVTTVSGCRGDTISLQTDTLNSIFLDVNSINFASTAKLDWNYVNEPGELFDIWKEYPANSGNWTQVATNYAGITWQEDITICGDNINYYVVKHDLAAGCDSRSGIDFGYFQDVNNNDTVYLESVSVNPNDDQTVTLKWLPSTRGDVVWYHVYRNRVANLWDSVATVAAPILTAQDINPLVDDTIQKYCVISEDSCGNKSVVGITNVSHNTVHSTAEMDICRGAIDIRWNPYLWMPGGLQGYNIYINGAWADFVSNTQTLYSHDTGLVNGNIYCYYVEAVGSAGGRFASSNSACDTAELLTLPKYSYLNKVSVVDLRRVTVEALIDTVGDVDVSRFKIQRSFNEFGPFYTIGYVQYNKQPRFSYLDNTAQTEESSYYYRIITVDSCGNEVLTSNVGRTIFLSGQPNFNLTNKILWNDYKEWLGGVDSYSVFRSIDGVWDNTTPVATLDSGDVEYLDDVTEIYQTTGRFCYRIAAYEGAGNTYGFTDTSYSNEFCLIQEPHLFVPNAFTPEGMNPIFRPQFIYTDAKNYKFIVFNRWGEKVFETENPQEGWNGTIEGTVAPQGTYVYSVRLFGTNGQELNKSGRVTLLR